MSSRILVYFATLITLSLFATASIAGGQEMEEKLKAAFDSGKLEGLHSVLVFRKGEKFAEAYFEGADQKWGTPLGKVEHGADTLHDLRSVTKSIVGLLYGIAHSEGLVPGLDECLVCQFPEYEDLNSDEERQKILIRHALSMQMGTDWNENLPYSNPKNSEIAMERSENRYRYVLDRNLVHEPGTQWTYNGGATAIIAELIARGSGKSLDQFAKEKLFDPLGFEKFEWVNGFNGQPSAASGLRLTTHDLAKIGQLILNKGSYDDKQIAPAEWLEASFTPHTDTAYELRYGYFWWLAPNGTPPQWVAGLGNGGQRLSVNPTLETIVVIFAGNYNKPDAWKVPISVIVDYLVPEMGL